MSSSEDSHDYETYSIEFYEDNEGPPLLKTRSRLIAAVVQNQVDVLRELLDSPKWYNVKDRYGYSLLQIAILRNNEEVFDYMLSIPDFPLEFVNRYKETALMVALTGFISNDLWMNQHFANELVKRGACIDLVCYEGNTPLHCALDRSYNKVALQLIKVGADLNVCNNEGHTPLSLAVGMSKGVMEVFTALLVEGAIPSNKNFEESVLYNHPLTIQELLFLYTFDQYSEIDFRVLLKLAANKSPLFHEIVKSSCKIIISDRYIHPSCRDLCSLEPDYLKLVIQTFSALVAKVLHHQSKRYWYYKTTFSIESLNVLIESEFKFNVIKTLGMLNGCDVIEDLLEFGYDESRISEVYLYLLSYGLVLREQDLQLVYSKFGNCELFKLLLHMDIELSTDKIHEKDILAVFMYDVTMNLQRFLENPKIFSYNSINQLYDYFVHPGLTDLYYQLTNEDLIPKRDQMAHIPCLLELARNSFRTYFIDTFKIKTARKFYTLLKHLPISIVHKKIISYETKLY